MDVLSSGGELVSGDVENPPETGRHSQLEGELVSGDVENPPETGRHSQLDGELVSGDVENPPETGRHSQLDGELVSGDVENPPDTGRHSQLDGELVSGDVENPPETGRHSQLDGELVRGDVENPPETRRHSQLGGELVSGDAENPPETGRDSQPRLRKVKSANFKRPLLDLSEEEARQDYLNLCVPLFKYASKGNWEKAKPKLEDEKKLLSAGIAEGWTTVLHVAAGAGHVHFVKELIKMDKSQDKSHLDLQDSNGNTALSFAAIAGNLEIVMSLYEENNSLPKIRNRTGFTPLLLAALQGRANVADYLYPRTTDDNNFDEAEWNMLFLTCIDSGIYDLALKVLTKRPELAFARDEDDRMTGLHIMAQKTEHLESGTKNSVAIQLVRLLWKEILKGVASKSNIRDIINKPSRLLFDATKVGNFDLIAELIKAYPDLIWEFDERRHSIIHAAVLHRHPKIFNLIHEYSGSKDIILAYKDDVDGNYILHLAAKLAPAGGLELVSGAAFQMKLELLWFQEVKKTVLPSYVKKKNRKGETPWELFTKEHAALRKDAEAWMKTAANSFMVVSTLIATGVFSVAFNVPGGTSDDSGAPNDLRKPWFTVFAISDAVAMISSSTSILAFLSILISRFAEHDFYKSLPSKLMFGLITLFISITSMMVAFSSAFFVTYDQGHGLKWVPSFISVLSILPIAIFLFFQFRLFYDIISSTGYLSSLFKPSNHIFD